MRLPLAPYNVELKMDMAVIPLANAEVHIQDYGTANDQYICELDFALPTTEATAFAELIESTNRGVAVSLTTLLGGAYPNFHPFGPHINLTSNDDIKIINYQDLGKADPFGEYWNFRLRIVPANVLACYSATTDCGNAGFRFGTLSNFYLPSLRPNIEYKVGYTRFGSGTFLYHNAENTQHKSLVMQWENIETEGARNILLELTKNVRSIAVTMNAGTNQWPFSLREGQGDQQVKIANTQITMSNIANLWTVGVEVIHVN